MLDLTSCDVTPVGPSILSQTVRRLEGLRWNNLDHENFFLVGLFFLLVQFLHDFWLRLLSTLITSDQMTWLFRFHHSIHISKYMWLICRSMTETSRLKMLSISLKSLDCTKGVKAELVGSALARCRLWRVKII